MRFKSKERRVRIIYSDDPGGVQSVKDNPGKVFAVIGPFDCHTDKPELMNALEMLCIGFNMEEPDGRS